MSALVFMVKRRWVFFKPHHAENGWSDAGRPEHQHYRPLLLGGAKPLFGNLGSWVLLCLRLGSKFYLESIAIYLHWQFLILWDILYQELKDELLLKIFFYDRWVTSFFTCWLILIPRFVKAVNMLSQVVTWIQKSEQFKASRPFFSWSKKNQH